MNLILFEKDEIASPLRRADPRAMHVLDTLRMRLGDRFDAGVTNGARGKARISKVDAESIELEFDWLESPAPPDPIDLIVGLPRPHSARRILHDAAALGVRSIAFVATSKSDPNYGMSRLWSSGEWRRHLIDGAQQAFDTHIPSVSWNLALKDVLGHGADSGRRLAFDNYETVVPFPDALRPTAPAPGHAGLPEPVSLAFGPERGWSAADRDMLRSSGFILASLGRRVLRVETAIVAAVAILRAELGWS